MSGRWDRSRLTVGAYCLAPYARTESHIREIADCGVDVMLCVPNDREMLDLMQACGVGAVVSGAVPGWFGGTGENAGQMERQNPIQRYETAAERFADHPAIWGIDIGDEPSALDFPHYGRVFGCVASRFPGKTPYLNLYPDYGMVPWNTPEERRQQLGVPDYAAYVDAYCRNVPSDYICFDFYQYAADSAGALSCLQVASDACRHAGRSLWMVLQVNSHRPEEWISENRIGYQAFSAMAFGAESIFWACWTAGWWHNQVLDERGERTRQYDRLRRVNERLHRLGEMYMRFRHVRTHFVADEPFLGRSSIPELSAGGVQRLRAAHGEALIVGEMAPRSGDASRALMLAAANDPMDAAPGTFDIAFSISDGKVRAFNGEGELSLRHMGDGGYALSMQSCGGVLLVVEQ